MGALPKQRTSHARQGDRRAHQALKLPQLVACPNCKNRDFRTMPALTVACTVAVRFFCPAQRKVNTPVEGQQGISFHLLSLQIS